MGALRGMSVSEHFRGQGLSFKFIAIWLELCALLDAGVATNRIDKPIVSLVLQKFGFEAVNTGTEVEVDVERGPKGELVVWGADAHKMKSQFSKRKLREQHTLLA